MVAELTGLWEGATAGQFKIHPRSPVPMLDAVYRHQLRPVITKGAQTMNIIFGDSRHG
ncbi:hypothetical protein ACIBKY_13640 [Nonomuraea sp. NPDC050394]|uniref:hypothetical protein n=1 Tax=Nonomuraea sp. NPDC050394 TaxID=3364363 RepID=UPI00379A042F